MSNVNPTANNGAEGEWESLLADYALGVLDPMRVAAFESDLQECRGHVALANDYGYVAGMLGLASSAQDPPQGHKERLLARLQTVSQEKTVVAAQPPVSAFSGSAQPAAKGTIPEGERAAGVVDLGAYRERRAGRLPALVPAIAAVAAALLIFVGLGGWWAAQSQANDLQAENAQLHSQLDQATTARKTAEDQAATLQQQLNIPASYIPFGVAGQGSNEKSWAAAFMNPQTNDLTMVARDLAPLPDDRVYELWWIPPGYPNEKPVAAGTFQADPSGWATHKVKSDQPLSEYAAIAVTDEPAPGGPTPKGPVVMLGRLPTK